MVDLEPDRTHSKQQTTDGPASTQYTPLDEARRSHNLPKDKTKNTSQISEYAPLHPSTLSCEISRNNVTIEKIIGKGAFGQVAKGTAIGLRGRPQTTLVAVKMLKGAKCRKLLFAKFVRKQKCCEDTDVVEPFPRDCDLV